MGVSNLLTYPQTFRDIVRLINRPLSLADSKALIRRRLAAREARFLRFVNRYIYQYPRSPYLALLRHAGAEVGDLQQMVRQHGLEGTLEALRDAGVYLSFEEFKGRMDVVRGGRTFRFAEGDFDNPRHVAGLEIRTGATRSRGSRVGLSLEFIAEQRAPSYHVMLQVIGAEHAPVFLWTPQFPSGFGISAWFALAHMRRPPLRWFSMTDTGGRAITWRHRVLLGTTRTLARPQHMDLPLPEFAPVSATMVVLDALLGARRRHGHAALITSPSAAVRVASLAREWNESLAGIHMLVGSEPMTPGKASEILSSGAKVGVMYVFSEGGAVGVACGDAAAADDMHFMSDCYAMILHRRPIVGVGELDAYMFTSLLDSAPKIMLNVESDDFGEFAIRRCSCEFDELGLHHHFASVRSFTKLTGEGATLLGTDCVRILEEVLPREFGGRSIDYQLLEAEDESHLTKLFLVISPELGLIDEQRVLARFVGELRRRPHGTMLPLWQEAGSVQVLRREPLLTPRGKLLPFHTQAMVSLLDQMRSTSPVVARSGPEG